MKRIFMPTKGPESWQHLLVGRDRHWKPGYSAYTLAHCWENADGFPREIEELFEHSSIAGFQAVELVLAIPEYPVPLKGGRRPSYNDIFALGKGSDGELIAIAVEGKVSESFGPTLKQWNAKQSPGRQARLDYLTGELGLTSDLPPTLRYQLLHRTVSALLEARRFNASSAVMIVHSFSDSEKGFPDYQAFVAEFDCDDCSQDLVLLGKFDGISLYAGWAAGINAPMSF